MDCGDKEIQERFGGEGEFCVRGVQIQLIIFLTNLS